MSRRRSGNFARKIEADRRFGSVLIQKLINVVMGQGKKGVATTIVYDAMDALVKKCNGDDSAAKAMFEKIVDSVKPELEVKSRRVGGGVYQVPTPVRGARSVALALRWVVSAAKSRRDKTMAIRLSRELLDASVGEGGAIKKKRDVHRMAEANRAFSHYAW